MDDLGVPPFTETSNWEISKTWTAKQRWWLRDLAQKKMSWSFPAREPVNFLWRYARQVIHTYIYIYTRVTSHNHGPKLKSSDCITSTSGIGWKIYTGNPHISWHKSMDGFQSLEAIATLTDSQSITVGFVPMFSWITRLEYVWITLFVCEFPMKLVENTNMFWSNPLELPFLVGPMPL